MIFPQCCKDSSQKHCEVSAPQKHFGFTALSKALPAPSPESPLCFWLRQNKKSRIFHYSHPWELGSFQGGVLQDKTHRDPSGFQGLEQRENSSTKIKGVPQDVTKQSHLSTRDRRTQTWGMAAPGAAPGDREPGPGSAGGLRGKEGPREGNPINNSLRAAPSTGSPSQEELEQGRRARASSGHRGHRSPVPRWALKGPRGAGSTGCPLLSPP